MNREGALPVCLAASKVFHRVCLSQGRILAHWREPVNRAINLRFRSLAVDHFANLASYSTVQWRKTMGKTMTGAKSFGRGSVLRTSFRLRPAPPISLSRPVQWTMDVHCCILLRLFPHSIPIFAYSFL